MAGREYFPAFQLMVSPEEQRRRDAIAQGIVQDELQTATDAGDTRSAGYLQQELRNRFGGKSAVTPTFSEAPMAEPSQLSPLSQPQSSGRWEVIDAGWEKRSPTAKSASADRWEDVSSQFMYTGPKAAPAGPDESFMGSAARGIKKTIPELKQAGAGVVAYLGDVLGADGMREWGLDKYQKIEAETKPLQSENDSFSKVFLDGEGSKTAWLGNAVGYTLGQVGTALVSGGIGALGGKFLAKKAITEGVERAIATRLEQELAAGAARDVAEQAALKAGQEYTAGAIAQGVKTGAITGAFTHNVTQELGGIYTDAVEQAKKEGRSRLDGGDLFRIGAATLAAAGVDTVADVITVSKAIKGGVGETIGARAAREIPAGMVREGATEAVQTGIEQYGAAKPFDRSEIIDAAALGAVGGGMAGGAASLRQAPTASQVPIDQAADAPITPVVTPDKLLALPSPTMPTSDGVMVAGPNGVRPQTFGDVTAREEARIAADQAAAERQRLGLGEAERIQQGVAQRNERMMAEAAQEFDRIQADRAFDQARSGGGYPLDIQGISTPQTAVGLQAIAPVAPIESAPQSARASGREVDRYPPISSAVATTMGGTVPPVRVNTDRAVSAVELSASGQPFSTEKAAMLSIRARGIQAVAVPVAGGYGIQRTEQPNATNVPAEPGVQPTGRSDVLAGNRQNLGDGGQRLPAGDNTGAVPAKPDAPASARPAGAVPAAQPVEALTPAKPAKPKKPRKEPTLIAAIKAAGGLRSEFARDLTGETPRRANQMYPFAFRRDGVDLSTMVHNGLLDDFLPPHLRSEVFNAPDAPANPDEAIAYIEDAIRNGKAASMRSWDTQMALAQDAMTERQLESVADEISDEMSQTEIEREIAALAATNMELNEVADAEERQYTEQQSYDSGEAAQAESTDSSGDPGARTGDAQDQGRAGEEAAQEVETQSLESRQENMREAWQKWFSDGDATVGQRNYAADFSAVVERNRYFDEWSDADVRDGEKILTEYLAARSKTFDTKALDEMRNNELRARDTAPASDPNADKFNRSPERALNELTDEQLDAVGKAIGQKWKKGASRSAFVERIGSTREVRDAYLAVIKNYEISSTVDRPNLELTSQTEGQIRGEEAQRAKQQAEQRARDNAPSPDDFTLTGSDRAADVGAARGQNSLFEPQSEYGQRDLFADEVPDNQRANLVERVSSARSDGIDAKTAVNRAEQRTLPGRYATGVKLEPGAVRDSAVASVRNLQDAALATSSLSSLVREHVDVVVTDRAGKILAVQRMFGGATSQASAYPQEIIKFVTAIKGSSAFYVAHNHPSDNYTLSDADRRLSNAIGGLAKGIAPEYRGIVSVTTRGYAGYSADGVDESGPFREAAKKHRIRYLEETVEKRGYLGPVINAPEIAKTVVPEIAQGQQGIVFLDAQYHPTGFFPVNFEDATKLLDGELARDIVAAAYRSRASAAMMATQDYAPGPYVSFATSARDGVRNVGALLARIEVRALDAINSRGASRALVGDTLVGDTLFQRARPTRAILSTAEDGTPQIDGDGITLAYANPAERLEFVPDDGQALYNFAIMAGQNYHGYVEAVFEDGKPIALYDIEINGNSRKGGYATKTVKALLDASADGKLAIMNIVPEAQGFWEKLGIGVQNREPGAAYSDTLTQEAFAGSPDGQNASRAQGDQRGNGSPSEGEAREPEVGSLPISELQWFADELKAKGASRLEVYQSVDDMPQPKRDAVLSRVPDGKIRGAYFRDTDTVALFSNELGSLDDALFTYAHEAFHRGLTKTLGPEAAPLLKSMHDSNATLRRLTQEQMDRHGIDQQEAIEEALADMPVTELKDLKGWDKLVALIRSWLGKLGDAVGIRIDWSDDMIATFVAGIRRNGMVDGVQVLTPDATVADMATKDVVGNQSGAPADDITRSNAPNAFDTDERAADRAARVADVEEDYRLPNIGNAVPPDYVPRQASQKNVTIYRGVPDHVKNAAIRPGDWVSLDKKYAQQHGTGETGRSKVISMTVPADHVGWAGTDMNEWFYAPRSSNESTTPDSSAFSREAGREARAAISAPSEREGYGVAPTGGMQERAVRAEKSGSPEPAQKSKAAASEAKRTPITAQMEADALAVANKEIARQSEYDVQQELESIQQNGRGYDVERLIAENPKYWDAENEELTPEGYAELDRRNEQIARDNIGIRDARSLADLDHVHQFAQADAFESLAEDLGASVHGSRSFSTSRYFEVTRADGKTAGFRFADHLNTSSQHNAPDFNIAPGGNTFKQAIDWLNESPTPDNSGVAFSKKLPATIEVDGQQRPTTNSNGQPIHPTEEGVRNFWRWFADSKVVDAQGRPLVVYHGTRNEFTTFDYSRIGEQGRAEGAGFYFTNSKDVAAGYGAAMEVFLAIKKPLEYSAKPFDRATIQKIVSRVAELEAIDEGSDIADGFLANFGDVRSEGSKRVIKTAADMIAADETALDQLSGIVGSGVRPQFVNQATRDVTGFDGVVANGFSNAGGSDNRIFVAFFPEQIKSATGNTGQFSPDNADIRFSRAVKDSGLFSKGQTDQQAEFDAAEGTGNLRDTVKELTAKAMNAARDRRGMFLQVLGRRQILDIYGKDVPELARYNDILQRMEAEQNDGAQNADSIVQAWRKLTSKRPDVARAMAELMHDATLAAYDPDVSQPNNTEQADIRKRWINLPDEAKQIYRQARDAYVEHFEKVKDALLARVERSGLDTKAKTRMLEQMRADFTKAMQGVYFPLARFGDYMVIVKNGKGETQAVSFAETQNQAAELRARLVRENPDSTVSQVQKRKEFSAERDGVSKGFMKDLVAVINEEQNGETREQMLDAVNQIYLSSIPDLSWAKSGIHRKGTPGYSQDAMRAFARNMFHGGYYLAKLNYGDQLQSSLMQMQADIDDKIKTDAGYSNIIAQNVVDEMNQRHKLVMNPNNTPVANFLTGLGFIFHMGLSPASAAVNLSQTALVAYPMMGAKFGFGKAMSALMKASGEAVKGKNDLLGQLTGDEKKAFEQAVKDGVIDLTMAHDLAGVSQGRAGTYNEKTDRVFRVASVMFHEAEKFNRGVTFLANFRLAKEAGQSNEAAAKTAAELTYASHFDYSANNRARIMQSPTARVLLLFKQYGQNMIYTLSRNTVKAFQGDKEAQKTLAGLLAMHGMFAGALGLPLVTTLLAAASAIGGSDDEPWDAQVALRNYLADVFGTEVGEVLAHGIFRAPGIKDVLGGDISGRVGLDSMLFRAPPDTLQGDKAYEAALMTAIGPVFGAGMNVAKGMHTAATGDIMRGVEEMMPKAIKDPLKALRYSKEGVVDKSRITLIDDTTVPEEVAQFLGFSPARSLEAYEGKAAIKEAETKLNQRRKELLNRYARARQDGDEAAVADVRDMIQSWNRANPTLAITGDTLLKSIQNRAKRQAEAENGVYLSKNKRGLSQLGDFAGVE